MITSIEAEDIVQLVRSTHRTPQRILGMHMVEAMGKRVPAVRAFFPDAKEAFVVDKKNPRARFRMEKIHPDGLFEAIFWVRKDEFPYKFVVVDYSDAERVVEDPYRYPETVTPFDRYLFNRSIHYRIYEKMGANLKTVDGVAGTHFSVWAPNAKRVSVIGEFNRWDGRKHQMELHEDSGVWEMFIPQIKEGDKYKFEIRTQGDELYVKTDPYGFYFEQPPANAAIVRDIGRYAWRDDHWVQTRRARDPLKQPILIYEVHLGSWRRVPEDNYRPLTYREAASTLVPYVKEMGYTHIELMPVMEHPFDGSWGYQLTGYFAPTSRFGTPEDFMAFVDAAHQNGIGVILDWVPGHFPRDAHGLVYFDGTALYEHADPRQGDHPDWGTKVFNFGRAEVKNFLISDALFWLDKYHIDGLRVDAVASMLYHDYSRKEGEWIPNCFGGRENLEAIEFFKHLNSKVYEYFPGVMMIAEESTSWPMVSRPAYMGGLGFGMKWNMGWMHDVLDYMTKDTVYRRYHHNQLTFGLLYAFTENFILPFSHDEVVHGKGSLIGRMPGDYWQKFANLRLLYLFMAGHPGKILHFMGDEFGQFDQWDYQKSLDWHLLQFGHHWMLREMVKHLNRLVQHEPALYEIDFSHEGFQWINPNDFDNSILSFIRKGTREEDKLVFVLNFTPVPRYGYEIGVPDDGFYVEIFNSDSTKYGGSGVGNGRGVKAWKEDRFGFPYGLSVTVPPLGGVILKVAGQSNVNSKKWRRIGMDRKAGVLVPLFSLRSRHSTGIGEIRDLEFLVDWCKSTGQKIIQLLPVNDTAYDAPPYCSTTAFALNPVYLSLQDIPGIDAKDIRGLQDEFEGTDRIVYWRVKGEKMRLLWKAYVHVREKLRKDASFQNFCRQNKYWLDTYAAFMVMKDKHEQQSWKTWQDAPEGTPEQVRQIVSRHADEIGFYRFLQWHLDRQWRRVRQYANERGVLMKGDIPYLLNNDAADVWAWRRLFNLDLVAGCPPDFYNAEGQYWSFPTYRWDEVERDRYRWWIERLRHAEKYFDIFRIDHVLGFFRIWSIPAGESATFGQFVPARHVTVELLRTHGITASDQADLVRRNILLKAFGSDDRFAFKWEFVKDKSWQTLPDSLKEKVRRLEDYFSENDEIQNDLWGEHGKKWLTVISQNTEMLICAEDLGTVPPCVRPCLEKLGIPKLLVDRWTKFMPTARERNQGLQDYWIEPWDYDPLSVSTPSNHDMPTLRGWWQEIGATEEGRRERLENLRRYGWTAGIPDRLDADAVKYILKRNLEGKSIFSILNIQDILDLNPAWQSRDPAEDRINLPGTYSERNWSWRMRVPLEELLAAAEFNQMLAAMVSQSGR